MHPLPSSAFNPDMIQHHQSHIRRSMVIILGVIMYWNLSRFDFLLAAGSLSKLSVGIQDPRLLSGGPPMGARRWEYTHWQLIQYVQAMKILAPFQSCRVSCALVVILFVILPTPTWQTGPPTSDDSMVACCKPPNAFFDCTGWGSDARGWWSWKYDYPIVLTSRHDVALASRTLPSRHEQQKNVPHWGHFHL